MASPLQGFSGSPVVVDDLVIGHVTRVLPDPTVPKRPGYGRVYAVRADMIQPIVDAFSESKGLSILQNLRPIRTYEKPTRPYPVLEAYEHPGLFAGRDAEIRQVVSLLQSPRPGLMMYSVSGAGKSSMIRAGLLPALSFAGHRVAVDSRPEDRGVWSRLASRLLRSSGDVLDQDYCQFADLLAEISEAERKAPVLILDQFERVFTSGSHALAWIGPALAKTAVRLPNHRYACQWILAYRQEFHGEVFRFLEDVLAQATDDWPDLGRESWVSDLTGAGGYDVWILPPLGLPSKRERRTEHPDRTDAIRERATESFLRAIEKPLKLSDENGRVFPYSFAPGHALRLAKKFGELRCEHRDAPLTPELQVTSSGVKSRIQTKRATNRFACLTREVPG